MQQETNGQLRESAASYREALDKDLVAALLGLERVFAQLGWNDSLVDIAAAAVKRSPAEPTARTVQLRVLHTLRREPEARAAFKDWVAAAPGEIEPYRAWSRLLLEEGRTATVDSVLSDASRSLGSMKGLTLEVAQLRAALGQWDHATVAWREAVQQQAYLETAASFSLRNAPQDARRVVRAVLLSPPVMVAPRRLLSTLELGWGNGREAWMAVSELPLDDSTAAIWQNFAQAAERGGQYLAARDAFIALQRWRPDAKIALRAATNAIEGGDPQSALLLATQAAERLGPREGPKTVLPTRLRAYAAMGRGADAQRAYSDLETQLSETERDAMRRVVASAWVRGGGVNEARAMLAGAQPNPDDELTGWLALYEGDLIGARRGLRRADTRAADAVFALAFISRTRVNTAPLSGTAFLTMARGDSVQAAAAFVRAVVEVPDAASVLLLAAARVHMAQRREAEAVALWKRILDTQNTSPEAPEAELEWARLLRRKGDSKSAVTHLEHLILSWPDSALLPQARHELDLARAGDGALEDARPS
jgi:tetratricopeptide (TPR) repeat protein